MKILVVRLDHLGDLLLTTPLVRALALAGNTVDVLVREALKPIFENSPYVKECFAVESCAPRFPKAWWQLASWMRNRAYDVIVLAYAKEMRLCFASAFSGAKRRIAMWGGLGGRVTLHQSLRSNILTQPRPVSEILLSCSRALGIPDQGLKPDIFLLDSERETVRTLLPASFRGRTLIGIHPGSAGNACNLPTEIYAELAALILMKTDCAIVVTGTTNEKKLLARWPSEVIDSRRVWVSMGKLSLRELACVISEMDLFVCSSTGPLHVASAVGTPTVSPFCPAVPLCAAIWRNTGAPARAVEPDICPARGGVNRGCDFRGQISAERMFQEILGLLTKTGTDSKSSSA